MRGRRCATCCEMAALLAAFFLVEGAERDDIAPTVTPAAGVDGPLDTRD